ncbi:MAG: hypothetical protein U0R77_11060 [Mycolicibacterium insubricum]|mgnify:CR=1|nr:hypothetical protein [Mycobacterium sp.]
MPVWAVGKRRAAGAGAAAVLTALATVSAPTAHADAFVQCTFSTAKPFIYSVDGADYIGGRLDVSNCRTNVPESQLTFALIITASGAPPGAMGPGQSNVYTDAHDVHNGDSFSVSYPNDDRLVPAYPGVIGTKVTVYSTLTGARDPRFLDYQCSTWQFQGYDCKPAQRV